MPKRKKQRALVTGGAGFIGSHLCDRLLDEGFAVLCMDNLSTGDLRNIAHLEQASSFEFWKHDIKIPFAVEADLIFNFACPSSPQYYLDFPFETLQTNVLGSINVLNAALQSQAVVIQASTSEIYGEPVEHPQQEAYWGNVNPIGPRSCYNEGKRCAEALFFSYFRKYNLPIKILRIFNTYGPRLRTDDGRVVSNFIVRSLKGQPLQIYGDGKQTRSFCYVSDLIEGVMRLAMTESSFHGPVNIGNPDEKSILQLAEMIKKLVDSPSEIIYSPLPQDDPSRRLPDIALAMRRLGWMPQIGIEEGLRRTIDYFRELNGL